MAITNLDTAAHELNTTLTEFKALIKVTKNPTSEALGEALGQIGTLAMRNTETLLLLLRERDGRS